VELGQGIQAVCRLPQEAGDSKGESDGKAQGKAADLSSLSSMLQARWKGGASAETSKPKTVEAGQVRSFRIVKLDRGAKKIEVELA
jgi:small subunit ribosomal protein S1